jgi:hypothetical protein
VIFIFVLLRTIITSPSSLGERQREKEGIHCSLQENFQNTHMFWYINVIDRCRVKVYSMKTICRAIDHFQSCTFLHREVYQKGTMHQVTE